MKMILVEDDDYKANQIVNFLQSLEHSVVVKKTFIDGIRTILASSWDFVLLDMTIPSFGNQDSRNRKFGGRDILREMKRKNICFPTVVITQYSIFGDEEITLEELDKELANNFKEIYKGYIYYNASVLDWQKCLQEVIDRSNENV